MQTVSNPQSSPQADLASESKTYMLDVSGMKCAGCSQAVERQLLQQGATAAAVNLVTATAMVQCPPAADPEQFASRLTEIGFPTALRGSESSTGAPSSLTPAVQQQREAQRRIRQVVIAASLLLFSTVGHLDQAGWIAVPGLSNIWLHWGLATLALLIPGRSILVSGWRGLRHNMPNMDSLVGLGALTAYGTSLVALLLPNLGWECFFDEPVMLIGFILLGRALEQQARSRATQSFQALIALQPSMARLVSSAEVDAEIRAETGTTAGTTVEIPAAEIPAAEIPAAQVRVGEWLQVLPGEKIPVDGQLVAGQTTVDEAMLTGEAMPILKQIGDPVTGGSLNLSGKAIIQATRTGQETTLAQIIQLVETAQTRKAPIQGLADRIAGYFTYGVMTLALLTFLFWYWIGLPLWSETIFAHLPDGALGNHMGMGHMAAAMATPEASPLLLSLKLAIAVLVIACPCALGLATPTAILVGSSLGAERGLLIRGGDVLEKVHELDLVAFDKTGTLTVGQPSLTDCISLDSAYSEAELLQIAATVESGTQHPLARAIQQAAAGTALLSAQEFHTEPGLGIAAVVAGKPVVIGTRVWLEQSMLVSDAAVVQAQRLAEAGKTPIYLGIAGKLAGLIAVQDQVRPEAKATVEQLRQMGLELRMLTGDQPGVAAAVATAVGLSATEVIAELRPDQKVAAIRELQTIGYQVAMIGDGINDAPALAQAEIGIALTSGTAVAIESAEIILMRDQLSDLVAAIRLSQATFNKIRQNLFWAFIYNALGLPLAAGALLPLGILLSPAAAGALMAFSSLSVVSNSLLLRRIRL
ncbi:MAG: heavy metal translocating P-type ATPase [Pegethrix bostrychoides GSE-TBD4-15B]|jgi:Cu2+-exporting ATPase|uniref:Heavy metal translocating P-type ATPase n=1 Tax=Pegethrix bostrychoides GSE-TBD4-15B TaxID=2839662 RepID=A0A951U4U7_9CYAN|nr:heavy metal translocating P-type ATPase [Pegethrix bostrychoides GSE-TBD4-15B]